jgi:hypothetical protein
LALFSAISEDFLRFALDARGLMPFWLFGVVGFGLAFGDWAFDCERVVRFISFSVGQTSQIGDQYARSFLNPQG